MLPYLKTQPKLVFFTVLAIALVCITLTLKWKPHFIIEREQLSSTIQKATNEDPAQRVLSQPAPMQYAVRTSVGSQDDLPVRIPSDAVLNNMTQIEVQNLYWDYINSIQALCRRVVRVGMLLDGGKEVCTDEPYRPRQPCLVYSFGINYKWDFDEDAVRLFGCEVFCFDPSMRQKGETYKYAKNITFYMIGLGPRNEIKSNKWKIETLEQIRRDLNHTEKTIDILKIDIENSEWSSLPQMVQSGTLRSVKQMQIELHGKGTRQALTVLRILYEDGFRLFMRDRNLNCIYSIKGQIQTRTQCMEVSMIRVT